MNPDSKLRLSFDFKNLAFYSEINKVLTKCEIKTNLFIGIYSIDDQHFFYFSECIERSLGYSSDTLLNVGWSFWFSIIDPHELFYVKSSINKYLLNPYSMDNLTIHYHIKDCNGKKLLLRHEIVAYELNGKTLAINYFFDASEQEQMEKCLNIYGGQRVCNFIYKKCNHISSREKEVLHLIADGFSSKQIAQKLCISDHTAMSHRKHLLKKFKVRNTAQLIKRASKVLEL